MARLRPGHAWGSARSGARPPTEAFAPFALAAEASVGGSEGACDIALGLRASSAFASSFSSHAFALLAEPRVRVDAQAGFAIDAVPGGVIVVGNTYPNGYAYRRRIVIAQQPDLAAFGDPAPTDLPLCLSADLLNGDWLKPAAAGGKLQSLSAVPGAAYSLNPALAAATGVPFAATAAWNIPSAGLATHAQSSAYVSRLLTNTEFLAQLDGFTFPVYLASTANTTRKLSLTHPGYHDSLAQSATIPWNPGWVPTGGFWDGNGNKDAQLIIVFDVDAGGFKAGTELDLYRVVDLPATGVLSADSCIKVPQSYVNGNGRAEASRGCGIANLAMLGRPAEAASAASTFGHALCISIPNVDNASALSFVAPAIKTDGNSNGQANGIPEGVRFVLNLTDAQITSWVATLPGALSAGVKAFAAKCARTMRDYGFIVSDHAGSSIGGAGGTGSHFYFEDRNSCGAAWTAQGLDDVTIGGKVYPLHLFDTLFTSGNLRAVVDSTQYSSLDAADPYATNFARHKATASPSAAQFAPNGLQNGVILTGGTVGTDGSVNNIGIWSKNRTGPGWRARYRTKKTSAAAPSAGEERFLLFHFGAVGDNSSSAFPPDLSAWPATTEPFSHTYRAHSTGGRLTMYRQTGADASTTKPPTVAYFKADDVAYNVVQTVAQDFPMLVNVLYDWDVSLVGNTLSVTQTSPDGTSRSAQYLDDNFIVFASPALGNFGLTATPGIVVEVTDFSVLPAGGDAIARDLRFELEDGTRLDHWTASYDGLGGAATCFVRMPSLVPSAQKRLYVYYGKPGLVASDENVPGALQTASAWRVWPSGADLTGKGRSLTPSGVLAAPILGLPGGHFASASFARISNTAAPAYLDNATQYASVMPIRLEGLAEGNIHRVGGSGPTGGAGTAEFSTFLDALAPDGSTVNVYNTGANLAQPPGFTTRTNEAVNSGGGVPVVGETRLLTAGFQSSQAPSLFLDDARLATTGSGTITSGKVALRTGDVEEVGAGSGNQATAAVGVYGPQVVLPFMPTRTWVGYFARGILAGQDLAGIGAEDAPGDSDAGPVAVPLRAAVKGQTDIDVLAGCFDPDNPTLTLQLDGQPPNGTLSVVAAKLRDNPVAGFSGLDLLPFRVSDGLKSSRSRVLATVTGTVVPGGDGAAFKVGSNAGLFPVNPNPFISYYLDWLPTPEAPIVTGIDTQAKLLTAITAADASKNTEIRVTPGTALAGGFKINKTMNAGKWLTIRSGSDLTSASLLRCTIDDTVTIAGDGCILMGFKMLAKTYPGNSTPQRRIDFQCDRGRATRNYVDETTAAEWGIAITGGTRRDIWIDRNEVNKPWCHGIFSNDLPSQADGGVKIVWNYIHDNKMSQAAIDAFDKSRGSATNPTPGQNGQTLGSDGACSFYIGLSGGNRQFKIAEAIAFNLVTNNPGRAALELKQSHCVVFGNRSINNNSWNVRLGAEHFFISNECDDSFSCRAFSNVYIGNKQAGSLVAFELKHGNIDVLLDPSPSNPYNFVIPGAKTIGVTPRACSVGAVLIGNTVEGKIQYGSNGGATGEPLASSGVASTIKKCRDTVVFAHTCTGPTTFTTLVGQNNQTSGFNAAVPTGVTLPTAFSAHAFQLTTGMVGPFGVQPSWMS